MGKCLMPQVFVIGGGGDEPIGEGDFLVRFFDYDGTILKQKRVDSGGSVIAPDAPTHTDIGLTFDEWTHDTSNVTGDMNVGATYYTTDGKTHLVVRSTVVTGKDIVLYLNKSDGSTLTVDWGDSTTNTFTNTGNFNTGTHIYTNYGDYTIKMWISDGAGTYGFGNATNITTAVGGSTQTQRDMLLKAYVGDNVTSIGTYAFNLCYALTSVVIPSSVTSISASAFNLCYALTSVVIPSSVTSISASAFNLCYALTSVVIPSSVTSISTGMFENCSSLTSVVIPNSVTSISTGMFENCSSLTSVVIPSSVTSIGYWVFSNCYALTSVVIPSSVTSISNQAFNNCPSLKTYVLERTANITTLGGTNAFTGIKSLTKIYVPDALVATYKSAANWSTYADYIYPISEKGVTHND